MKVAASPRSFGSGLSFSFHRLINNRRFSALRMTKWGDARRLTSPSFQREGREDGLDDARSLKLTVLSYLKPNPQLLISSHQSLPLPLSSPFLML